MSKILETKLQPVQTLRKSAYCPCGGEYKRTLPGQMYSESRGGCYPYLHYCQTCKEKEWLGESYPHLVYEEVDDRLAEENKRLHEQLNRITQEGVDMAVRCGLAEAAANLPPRSEPSGIVFTPEELKDEE